MVIQMAELELMCLFHVRLVTTQVRQGWVIGVLLRNVSACEGATGNSKSRPLALII